MAIARVPRGVGGANIVLPTPAVANAMRGGAGLRMDGLPDEFGGDNGNKSRLPPPAIANAIRGRGGL